MILYTGNDPEPVDVEAAGLRLATRDEIIAAVSALTGVETRQWPAPIEVMPKGRRDLGSEFPAGVYLIVPVESP